MTKDYQAIFIFMIQKASDFTEDFNRSTWWHCTYRHTYVHN